MPGSQRGRDTVSESPAPPVRILNTEGMKVRLISAKTHWVALPSTDAEGGPPASTLGVGVGVGFDALEWVS